MAEAELLVEHPQRLDYGRGRVTLVLKGCPEVYRVEWPVKAPNGLPLWGYYRATDVREWR